MEQVFVYGTLQNGEVLKALTGKKFPMKKAKLSGYKVFGITDRYYPAIIKSPGCLSTGYLVGGMDMNDMKVLTEWEGDEYKPIKVEVDGVDAVCFVWTQSHENFIDEWDNANFRKNNMSYVVETKIPAFLSSRSAS